MRGSRRYFPQVMDANGDWISAGGRSVSESFAVMKMARAVMRGYRKGRVLASGGGQAQRAVVEISRAAQ